MLIQTSVVDGAASRGPVQHGHVVSLFFIRHMKGSPHLAKAPGPALGFMTATLGSELGTALQSEEDEEDEGYGMSRKLSGFEYTPGRSVDHLDGPG